MARVAYKSVTVDRRTLAMCEEADRLVPGVELRPTQGAYSHGSLSAGTHSGGGAVDFSTRGLTSTQISAVVKALRKVGFAAWFRTSPEWKGAPHIHAVAVGCPDLHPSAARQVASLRNGRNGLANNGLDRHRAWKMPVVTWEQYNAAKNKSRPADKPAGQRATDKHEPGSRTLRKGDRGTDVKYLQRHIGVKLVVDGDFGPATEAAVNRLKRARGLKQDGVCGSGLWAHIIRSASGS